MSLNIKSPEADRLARELAELTGESLTDAVIRAMNERLERERARVGRARLLAELSRIRERHQRLPLMDARRGEEILGYDDHGLPRG